MKGTLYIASLKGFFMKKSPLIVVFAILIMAVGFSGCSSPASGTPESDGLDPSKTPQLPKGYNVTFNSDGGTSVASANNVYGIITQPVDPIRNSEGGSAGSSGWYNFDGWFKDAGLTNQWFFGTDKVTTDTTLYAKWVPLKGVGDSGPGNGRIFYVAHSGFTMEDTGITNYYMEAALVDVGSGYRWASVGYEDTFITTGKAIGAGRNNTKRVIDKDPGSTAARACSSYLGGSLTDWFLPSIDELGKLYAARSVVGNFVTADAHYWSSSEISNPVGVWSMSFNNGIPDESSAGVKVETHNHTRPVRSF